MSPGIAFSTLLITIGFVVTVWCAFRHYNPYAGALEAARRQLRRARRSLAGVERRTHRRAARLHKAWNRRRHLAQHAVAGADRIAAQGRHAARPAQPVTVEPAWLVGERSLAAAPGPADARPLSMPGPQATPAITPDEAD